MATESYYIWNNNNLIIELHVQTKASKNAIIGEYNHRLKIAITTAPTDGKANDHLVKFFATYFGVPKNQIKIIRGLTSKHKSIMVSNPQKNLDKFN